MGEKLVQLSDENIGTMCNFMKAALKSAMLTPQDDAAIDAYVECRNKMLAGTPVDDPAGEKVEDDGGERSDAG